MATWRNPLTDVRPMTIGIFLLTALWAAFQWLDPTPPPVLDQILVAAFGVWFANEAIDKKNNEEKAKGRKRSSRGTKGRARPLPSVDDEEDEGGETFLDDDEIEAGDTG